jgi:hypothetical protein
VHPVSDGLFRRNADADQINAAYRLQVPVIGQMRHNHHSASHFDVRFRLSICKLDQGVCVFLRKDLNAHPNAIAGI